MSHGRTLDAVSRKLGTAHRMIVDMLERRTISKRGLKDVESVLQTCLVQLHELNQKVNK